MLIDVPRLIIFQTDNLRSIQTITSSFNTQNGLNGKIKVYNGFTSKLSSLNIVLGSFFILK